MVPNINQTRNAQRKNSGAANLLYLFLAVSIVLLGFLFLGLYSMNHQRTSGLKQDQEVSELFFFCAAGLRKAVEKIAADYEKEYGVRILLQYGGSNTLLSQIEVSRTGDLYLAADESYIELAQKKNLVEESIAVAFLKPVIGVARGNPKNITDIDSLLQPGIKIALANPDQAAVGKKTRKFLTRSGHWKRLEALTREHGVFKPTVTEIANDVKIGSVDAAIIWDATAAQYSEIDAIPLPELNSARSSITAGILKSSKNPTAALKFARYLSSRDKGLKHFESFGYEIIEGDVWKEVPELTFFAGSVNRRTLEPILKAFSKREGLDINTVYNGCGILTAQMNLIKSRQGSGFPDFYMACDVYYLDTVKDWFQDAVNVSNTEIVLVVQKGNPKNIRNIDDLKKQGIRIAVGQPDQCTIGVLTRKLLEMEGVYQELLKENIVTQTLTSALLIPNVTTKSVDATFAYECDTLFEQDKLEIIRIDSPAAKAIQPYSISQSSDFKYLGRRLFRTIADSRELFEEAGFNWQLSSDGSNESNTDAP